MEKDLATLNQPENFEKLSENLNKNVDLLTANCTMKGQAHDELHKWLVPYIALVKDFSEDKSAEKLSKITTSFTSFKNCSGATSFTLFPDASLPKSNPSKKWAKSVGTLAGSRFHAW